MRNVNSLKTLAGTAALAAILAVPVLVLSMGSLLPGDPISSRIGHGLRAWLEFGLATPVILWSGWPFFVRGYKSVVNRSLNMFTLIALGVGVAWSYSIAFSRISA